MVLLPVLLLLRFRGVCSVSQRSGVALPLAYSPHPPPQRLSQSQSQPQSYVFGSSNSRRRRGRPFVHPPHCVGSSSSSSLFCVRRMMSSSSINPDDDANDATTGAVKVIPRAAVSVIVRSPTPSYIVVQRGKEPNLGLWSLPGGKLEGGETTLEGAQRELYEECQICSKSLQWFTGGAITVTDSIHYDEQGTLLFHYVIAQCFAIAPMELNLLACDDAADAKWQTLNEIRDKVEQGQTTPGVLRVVEQAERMFQQGLLVDNDNDDDGSQSNV